MDVILNELFVIAKVIIAVAVIYAFHKFIQLCIMFLSSVRQLVFPEQNPYLQLRFAEMRMVVIVDHEEVGYQELEVIQEEDEEGADDN